MGLDRYEVAAILLIIIVIALVVVGGVSVRPEGPLDNGTRVPWERIAESTYRLRTPDGWIVRYGEAVVEIHDPEHTWLALAEDTSGRLNGRT